MITKPGLRNPAVDPRVENARVGSELFRRIARDLFTDETSPRRLETREWEILDYSSCFSIEWEEGERRDGVYVKIPKADIDRRTVLPEKEADRRLAEDEFRSLAYVQKHWDGSAQGVSFVILLAFYGDYNALVTRRAYGRDLLVLFRKADLRRKFWRALRGDSMLVGLNKVGRALRDFHRRSREAEGFDHEEFRADRLIAKVDRICDDLRRSGVDERRVRPSLERLGRWRDYAVSCPMAMTLKGLEIRNILIGDHGQIHLFDPGRLKRDFHQADLARLLVTCRILYWGAPWFALRLHPDRCYERAVLEGYYADSTQDQTVLKLHIIKELCKQWRMAYVALRRKRWPAPVEWLLGRSYIDPFYAAQVAQEIRGLGR